MAVVLLIIAAVIGYILYATGKISFDRKELVVDDVDKNELVIENESVDPPDDDPGSTDILVPTRVLPQRKKGFTEVCEEQEDCASGLDCKPGSDGTNQCLRRITMDNIPGADKTPIPGTNLGVVEEGDRFFIRNRHYGRCIGRGDDNTLKHSPVGYGCKREYQNPCNPAEDAPMEDQCSYGLVCAPDDDTDGTNKCLLNPQMTNYTEDKLPTIECHVWTIPCDTTDEKYHWTSIDIQGTNKQKFKMVGTNQCLALKGNNTSRGWRDHFYMTLQPCDIETQHMVEWEKTAEPGESGVVSGEVFVPDPYYSIKSANPTSPCIGMMGWNFKMPNTTPLPEPCSRSLKNSMMHFNFPIINS